MSGRVLVIAIILGAGVNTMGGTAFAQERQITHLPRNHNLDNNDNFSSDGRFLCYDTRETVGPGINNSLSIEKVEIATEKEIVLYAPEAVTGENSAPGVGACSFSPVADRVAFIHGPLLSEVKERGYYGKPNRNGAEVLADGSQTLSWLDFRDVAKDRDTLPGAHRGGTHRHEYTLDGKRIGFTYDDFLLPQYDRTIGYMEPSDKAPGNATHFFAILVPVAPMGKSKAGELEKAVGDSWVGREGLMRAFIGKVRAADGVAYEESLYVVDVPRSVDITTAEAGSATRYPQPPKGVKVRRLTQGNAGGIVRGSVQGDRIAYYAKGSNGKSQIFLIPPDGSDQATDPAKRPVQATDLPEGAGSCVRWHPSGNSIAFLYQGGIAVTCVKQGPKFGKTVFVTPRNDGPERQDLVWSPDGTMFAFSKQVPTPGDDGKPFKTYKGEDPVQIYVVPFPDADGDGIADGV